MVFTIFSKKKLKEESLASIFTNWFIRLYENSSSEIIGIINDSPEFIESPKINENDTDKLFWILLSGNLMYIPEHFFDYQDKRLIDNIINKFSVLLESENEKIRNQISTYQRYIKRVNLPSKNVLYGMSKAIFFKYDLSRFEEDYFKNLNAPNPLFLKRMNQVIETFLFDWKWIKEKYNIIQ